MAWATVWHSDIPVTAAAARLAAAASGSVLASSTIAASAADSATMGLSGVETDGLTESEGTTSLVVVGTVCGVETSAARLLASWAVPSEYAMDRDSAAKDKVAASTDRGRVIG